VLLVDRGKTKWGNQIIDEEKPTPKEQEKWERKKKRSERGNFEIGSERDRGEKEIIGEEREKERGKSELEMDWR